MRWRRAGSQGLPQRELRLLPRPRRKRRSRRRNVTRRVNPLPSRWPHSPSMTRSRSNFRRRTLSCLLRNRSRKRLQRSMQQLLRSSRARTRYCARSMRGKRAHTLRRCVRIFSVSRRFPSPTPSPRTSIAPATLCRVARRWRRRGTEFVSPSPWIIGCGAWSAPAWVFPTRIWPYWRTACRPWRPWRRTSMRRPATLSLTSICSIASARPRRCWTSAWRRLMRRRRRLRRPLLPYNRVLNTPVRRPSLRLRSLSLLHRSRRSLSTIQVTSIRKSPPFSARKRSS